MSDSTVTTGIKIIITLASLLALPVWLAVNGVPEVSVYSAVFWGLMGYFSVLIPHFHRERIGDIEGLLFGGYGIRGALSCIFVLMHALYVLAWVQ